MRIWGLALMLAVPLWGQWSLQAVVERAGSHYAGVDVSLEQASAAAAAVAQARLSYLPHADFYAQVNRATRNNVYGMLLPNRAIAPISGPVSGANAGSSAWGTVSGFLVSWEPFDFGQRAARVGTANAGRQRAERAFARSRFEVEVAAADAYLSVLAADATAEKARAALERTQALESVVTAQAESGLKPGADAARARGERAAAEAQLIQAEQAARTARIGVAQYAGGRWEDVQPAAAFAARMPAELPGDAGVAGHPALREQQAALDEAESRQREAALSWRPHFSADATLYGRGAGGAADFGPHFYNWGLGFSLLFPILDLPAVRLTQQTEQHRAASESARLRQVRGDLTAQLERARAALEGALRVARVTPVALEAAGEAERQARARYQSGLAGIVEVAEAQRMLAQAEVDHSLARLNIWRAHLNLAAAEGDLGPFLERAK